MLFKKIRVKVSFALEDDRYDEYWCLILRNAEEVFKYMELDAEMYEHALLSMRRNDATGNVRLDHLGSHREKVLGTFISYRIQTAPEGEDVWPHQVLGDIVGSKGRALMQAVMDGPVQVNQAGGWSHHDAFIKMHKCTVVDEIEKDSCTLPCDDTPIAAKVLVLENGTSTNPKLYRYCQKMADTYPRVIAELKEKDPDWVAKSIASSKIIVMETQAVDDAQIDAFMRLFSSISRKDVHICTSNRTAIQQHELFAKNSKLHNITFFDLV